MPLGDVAGRDEAERLLFAVQRVTVKFTGTQPWLPLCLSQNPS